MCALRCQSQYDQPKKNKNRANLALDGIGFIEGCVEFWRDDDAPFSNSSFRERCVIAPMGLDAAYRFVLEKSEDAATNTVAAAPGNHGQARRAPAGMPVLRHLILFASFTKNSREFAAIF